MVRMGPAPWTVVNSNSFVLVRLFYFVILMIFVSKVFLGEKSTSFDQQRAVDIISYHFNLI